MRKFIVCLAISASMATSAFAGPGQSDAIVRNPDGSTTLKIPRLLRGNESLRLWGYAEGVCAIFGFNRYMKDTYKDERVSTGEALAVVNNDGSYNSRSSYNNPIREITCYNEGTLVRARHAERIYRNVDGSYTLEAPRLLLGNDYLRLWGYAEGVCNLFGFNRYLKDSYKDERIATGEALSVVNNDGSYNSRSSYNNPIREITCYNEGELRNVGSAGGVIFYDDGQIDEQEFVRQGIRIRKIEARP